MSDLRVIKMVWCDPEFGWLWSESQMIERGWTRAAIRKQLGGPDCYGLNPRGGAYVHLYSQNRVREVADPPARFREIERLIDPHQTFFDDVQKIVSVFVQNDEDLGELLLDYSQDYWDDCYDKGLTVQQGLDRFLKQGSEVLAAYKAWKKGAGL
jgi:hypothetical protein